MPLNELNRDAIAFKRLVGKAHTQQGFSFTEESITSNIQISYSTIFAEDINPIPETSGLTSLGDTDGIVERVKFEIDIIPDTQIGTNQSQGYQLKLPAGYSGVLSPIYSGGTYLNSALGKLQIVPALYGTVKGDGSTEYDPTLFQTNGSTEIAKFDPINWILDTYSGILFVQDPPSGYDVSASRPGFVEAFLYVGDYLDSFSGATGGTGTASGERIEGDFEQIGNGFALGDVIGWDNGLSQFRTVVSNDLETINPEGIVTSTGDTFTITFAGYTNGISGVTDVNSNPLSGGTTYFLSETTAGKLTPNEPLNVGDISKPMISTFTVDDGVVYQYRGALITPATSGDTGFSGVTDGTNVGGGAEVFDQLVGASQDTMQFRTLVGSGGTNVFESGDTIVISGGSGGGAITTTLITTTSDYAVGNSNQNLIASGTTGYTMPSSPTTGVEVTISDGLGSALTTPITIQGNGNNILDDSFALINTDYGSITFIFNGLFWTVKGFVN